LSAAPNAHNPNAKSIVMIGESFGFVHYFDYPNFHSMKNGAKKI